MNKKDIALRKNEGEILCLRNRKQACVLGHREVECGKGS